MMNESADDFCFNLAFVFHASQTPAFDDLGQVCKTGIYRSIRHVEFPKFQTINTEKEVRHTFRAERSLKANQRRVAFSHKRVDFTPKFPAFLNLSAVRLFQRKEKKFHP